MRYINKNCKKHKREGHSIINSLIRNCWKKDIKRYVNLDYDELNKNKKFKSLLLKEQRGYCCYCMRDISLEKVTLEHVMPHHIDGEKQEEEKKHYYFYISPRKIIYQPDIDPNKKLRCPPYPHCIAYENLTASCDGAIYEGGEEYKLHRCCNNKRENDKIIPLFFLPDVGEIIIYAKDGRLVFADEYKKTIDSLNLECPSLRLIRKVWARIKKNNIPIVEIKAAKHDWDKRMDIIVSLSLDGSEENNIKNNLYWNLLLQFHWFYNYYN